MRAWSLSVIIIIISIPSLSLSSCLSVTLPNRSRVGPCRLSAYSVRTPAKASVAREAYPDAAPARAAAVAFTRPARRALATETKWMEREK